MAVEHNKEWYAKIKRISPKNVVLCLAENEKEYLNIPEKFGKFDFVLVDGIERERCLARACSYVKKNGVVLLHDANRNYRIPESKFKHVRFLRDYRKNEGGFAILANSEVSINMRRYVKIFRIFNTLPLRILRV